MLRSQTSERGSGRLVGDCNIEQRALGGREGRFSESEGGNGRLVERGEKGERDGGGRVVGWENRGMV